jgi:hypothetical protein
MRSLAVVLVLAGAAAVPAVQARRRSTFTVVEATIPQMQQALRKKRVTSRELVEQYLERIAMYNDKLHATIAVNPKALEEADQLDREARERKDSRPAPWHPHCAQGQRADDAPSHDRRRIGFRRVRAAL